ncbi:hypothetical protein M404DRAFT_1002860 [Pisolithus tinctorius Marx 270]|uniref:Uncharacterized protein n=1 Tax=Pisolithus tinctorius Marx 270 TaxID=870435 RepID=A0A0C3P370_PISTI|nr:hypothetical protein M404DRAFT_1002860 [Pisolithus tinctorius Marx 270]
MIRLTGHLAPKGRRPHWQQNSALTVFERVVAHMYVSKGVLLHTRMPNHHMIIRWPQINRS